MNNYIKNSTNLIDSFKSSNASNLAREIMTDRDRYEHLKINSASRDVYRIGSFFTGNEERHAILKLERRLAESSKTAFEAYFFNQCNLRDDIEVPNFVMLPKLGLTQGIIMEDLSQGGKYSVEQLADMHDRTDLLFLNNPDYLKAKFNFLHNLHKVEPISTNHNLFPYFYGESGKILTETSAFVVHDKKDFKRLVCADVDQFHYYLAKYISSSKIKEIEPLLFDL